MKLREWIYKKKNRKDDTVVSVCSLPVFGLKRSTNVRHLFVHMVLLRVITGNVADCRFALMESEC